jgi:hypothetical protein
MNAALAPRLTETNVEIGQAGVGADDSAALQELLSKHYGCGVILGFDRHGAPKLLLDQSAHDNTVDPVIIHQLRRVTDALAGLRKLMHEHGHKRR